VAREAGIKKRVTVLQLIVIYFDRLLPASPQGQSTFKTFEQDDPRGYIESIEDRTTVPLHFGHSHSTLDLLLRKRQEVPLPKTETPAMP
jgi:hypothetical protein